MIRPTGVLLALVSCACCGGAGDASAQTIEPPDWHAAGSDWLDLDAMDRTAAPADDFYRFVNGAWLTRTAIPEQVPWISPYVENYFLVRERLGRIVRDVASRTYDAPSDAQRVGEFYRSYLDVAKAESLGLDPLRRELDAVAEIRTVRGLAERFAQFNRRHFRQTDSANRYSVPFVITARPDDRDAGRVAAVLLPAGLGMSNRENYVSSEQRHADIRARYLAHIGRTLALAGVADADIAAARILELETKLARARASLTEQMDHERNYARLSRADLEQLVPKFDWNVYLDAADLASVDAFVVPDRGYFGALDKILRATPLDDWKAYLTWQLLRIYSPYLSRAFVDEDFAFFGRVELGNEAPLPRAELAVVEVEQPFSELLGRLYVELYFSAEAKARVAVMAEAIREQFRQGIRNLDWMGDATKRAALDKLDKLTVKVGYPDRWRSYDDVEIDAGDLVGNLMRINAAAYGRNVASIGKPVDRLAWQTPAYASSAYYYRVMNEVAIPAGYLLPPWYDVNAEPAMNYGGIGTVIGHEMGHAFDNQGSQYDGDGNLDDWWTDADRAAFVERAERLVAQYGRYSPAPQQRVDGRLTLSENIGDLTGLTIAYRAFEAATRDAPPPIVAGFTGEQRFFIAFATHWRALYRDALLTRILTSDGHPPQQYRANGPLANFEPFYQAFAVKDGDGMFLPKEERVEIW